MFSWIKTYFVLFKKILEVSSFKLVEITYSYRFSSCKWTKKGATAYKYFYSQLFDAFVIAKEVFSIGNSPNYSKCFYESTHFLFYLRKCLKYHLLSLYTYRLSSCKWTKRVQHLKISFIASFLMHLWLRRTFFFIGKYT